MSHRRVAMRLRAVILGCARMGLGFVVLAGLMMIRGLAMMVRRGLVMRSGVMMMLAGCVLGGRHFSSLLSFFACRCFPASLVTRTMSGLPQRIKGKKVRRTHPPRAAVTVGYRRALRSCLN